ncbi:NAD-dependent epimerase/dehydratase family protein [Rhodohalobacter sp. 614A]|uniref:NAD-dependent epimerase/dehydratase family protein n=1 Tax=Rhodohalobacter sp. 614A TaxID=2908649 RepID=UPI001F1DB626|nr:NAD-dependent epimerase/dehydratase family protein [Rhodohalobacter sp. 614A]
MKVIITGTTGMVGEGVLLECLQNPNVDEVLSVSRKPTGHTHPKLNEYIVPEFLDLTPEDEQMKGYDACFYCAGVSSVGTDPEVYQRITYDTTIHFAKVVLKQNPDSVFIYITGAGTDSTESGRLRWARVKGKTENDLIKLDFKGVYNFRPAFMKAMPGQQHLPTAYKLIGWTYPFFKAVYPKGVSTLKQVAQAMIKAVSKGYSSNILEVKDINKLAES